ncbi:MAG: hypothetical protein IJW18_03685 [Lachnospiraceae bacterium]|nr:hypothetical protein [Lachnospiraceae bacterium]
MKCKKCGANYRTIELSCPYCHTENLIGKLWMKERSEAELEYEKQRKEIGKKSSLYVADRILTRSILIAVLMFVVLIAGVFIYALSYQGIIELRNKLKHEEILSKLEEYYDNREFGLMDEYMSDMQLDGQDYYVYTQITLLDYYYNRYLNSKYGFIELGAEELAEDDYYLYYAVDYSMDVYNMELGVYSELDPVNKEIYDEYAKEIMSFWVGTLKLTDEEIAILTEEDGYITTGEMDALLNAIKERYTYGEAEN